MRAATGEVVAADGVLLLGAAACATRVGTKRLPTSTHSAESLLPDPTPPWLSILQDEVSVQRQRVGLLRVWGRSAQAGYRKEALKARCKVNKGICHAWFLPT